MPERSARVTFAIEEIRSLLERAQDLADAIARDLDATDDGLAIQYAIRDAAEALEEIEVDA